VVLLLRHHPARHAIFDRRAFALSYLADVLDHFNSGNCEEINLKLVSVHFRTVEVYELDKQVPTLVASEFLSTTLFSSQELVSYEIALNLLCLPQVADVVSPDQFGALPI